MLGCVDKNIACPKSYLIGPGGDLHAPTANLRKLFCACSPIRQSLQLLYPVGEIIEATTGAVVIWLLVLCSMECPDETAKRQDKWSTAHYSSKHKSAPKPHQHQTQQKTNHPSTAYTERLALGDAVNGVDWQTDKVRDTPPSVSTLTLPSTNSPCGPYFVCLQVGFVTITLQPAATRDCHRTASRVLNVSLLGQILWVWWVIHWEWILHAFRREQWAW